MQVSIVSLGFIFALLFLLFLVFNNPFETFSSRPSDEYYKVMLCDQYCKSSAEKSACSDSCIKQLEKVSICSPETPKQIGDMGFMWGEKESGAGIQRCVHA